MQRLSVIAQEGGSEPLPKDVVTALIRAAFPASAASPRSTAAHGNSRSESPGDLASVVQTRVAEHLMTLAASPSATPEVRAAALAGVIEVQKLVHAASSPAARLLDHEITLYLANPHDNTPKLVPSGAPPGPPV
jgi:hypothetical protein